MIPLPREAILIPLYEFKLFIGHVGCVYVFSSSKIFDHDFFVPKESYFRWLLSFFTKDDTCLIYSTRCVWDCHKKTIWTPSTSFFLTTFEIYLIFSKVWPSIIFLYLIGFVPFPPSLLYLLALPTLWYHPMISPKKLNVVLVVSPSSFFLPL